VSYMSLPVEGVCGGGGYSELKGPRPDQARTDKDKTRERQDRTITRGNINESNATCQRVRLVHIKTKRAKDKQAIRQDVMR
jgi:hypothetical protein